MKDIPGDLGKVEINLHDIAESIPTRFRLVMKRNNPSALPSMVGLTAIMEVVVSLNPGGDDFIPDDSSSTASDFSFLREVVDDALPYRVKSLQRTRSELTIQSSSGSSGGVMGSGGNGSHSHSRSSVGVGVNSGGGGGGGGSSDLDYLRMNLEKSKRSTRTAWRKSQH